jgi:hypothetical protein
MKNDSIKQQLDEMQLENFIKFNKDPEDIFEILE